MPSCSPCSCRSSPGCLGECGLECEGVSLLANTCSMFLAMGEWPMMWKTPPLLPSCSQRASPLHLQ